MPRQNVPLLSFNRGIISPKALARVDLDRTRLSAEIMRNWLAKTQGAMTLRPGTKYFGSSLNDTGAAWIEFVAATDDVALLELANDTGSGVGAMRVWLGSDPHNIALLSRPYVDTTVSLSDTGWEDASTGGALTSVVSSDIIPTMTGATTNGVTIDASSEHPDAPAWQAADDDVATDYSDTGQSLPSWWRVDFGSGNSRAVRSYTIRAGDTPTLLDNAPKDWTLEGSNDGSAWTVEDTRSGKQSILCHFGR